MSSIIDNVYKYSRFRNFPGIWKISHIIPIFKKGDATKPVNYWPISILPSTLILFEKILSNNLTFYLRSNNYITKCQYGFLAGKSTELQLISIEMHS